MLSTPLSTTGSVLRRTLVEHDATAGADKVQPTRRIAAKLLVHFNFRIVFRLLTHTIKLLSGPPRLICLALSFVSR